MTDTLTDTLTIARQYDNISYDFDMSRTRIWNAVKLFIPVTNKNLNLLDAGSGNGKNMLYAIKHGYKTTGFDISNKLLEISKKKGLDVYYADILNDIYLRKHFMKFDKIICIAVIHHINDITKQKHAILNLIALLSYDGELLISVWSYEIDNNETNRYYRKFTVGHNYFKWKNKEDRYYYIHDKESFNTLIKSVAQECNISYNITYEKQNWFCKIKIDYTKCI